MPEGGLAGAGAGAVGRELRLLTPKERAERFPEHPTVKKEKKDG